MATALVTGSNRGIGLELCRLLAARGEVIAVCRKASPELAALGVRVEEGIDVAAADAPDELARRVGGAPLDLIVQNAGILTREGLGDDFDADAIRRQIEVNAVAPLRLTRALAGNLRAGSKVALMTSLMGSMGDNGSGGYYGYRMSKAALNAAGVSLARDLGRRGVAVAILHPGFVRTEMTGGMGNWDAPEAAAALLARIDELTVETSGRFVHANGKPLPW